MHRHSQTSNIDRNAATVTTIISHLFPESRETHASQPSFLKLLNNLDLGFMISNALMLISPGDVSTAEVDSLLHVGRCFKSNTY